MAMAVPVPIYGPGVAQGDRGNIYITYIIMVQSILSILARKPVHAAKEDIQCLCGCDADLHSRYFLLLNLPIIHTT